MLEQIFYPHLEEILKRNAICTNDKVSFGIKTLAEFWQSAIHSTSAAFHFQRNDLSLPHNNIIDFIGTLMPIIYLVASLISTPKQICTHG